jgi:hypothetical protein
LFLGPKGSEKIKNAQKGFLEQQKSHNLLEISFLKTFFEIVIQLIRSRVKIQFKSILLIGFGLCKHIFHNKKNI